MSIIPKVEFLLFFFLLTYSAPIFYSRNESVRRLSSLLLSLQVVKKLQCFRYNIANPIVPSTSSNQLSQSQTFQWNLQILSASQSNQFFKIEEISQLCFMYYKSIINYEQMLLEQEGILSTILQLVLRIVHFLMTLGCDLKQILEWLEKQKLYQPLTAESYAYLRSLTNKMKQLTLCLLGLQNQISLWRQMFLRIDFQNCFLKCDSRFLDRCRLCSLHKLNQRMRALEEAKGNLNLKGKERVFLAPTMQEMFSASSYFQRKKRQIFLFQQRLDQPQSVSTSLLLQSLQAQINRYFFLRQTLAAAIERARTSQSLPQRQQNNQQTPHQRQQNATQRIEVEQSTALTALPTLELFQEQPVEIEQQIQTRQQDEKRKRSPSSSQMEEIDVVGFSSHSSQDQFMEVGGYKSPASTSPTHTLTQSDSEQSDQGKSPEGKRRRKDESQSPTHSNLQVSDRQSELSQQTHSAQSSQRPKKYTQTKFKVLKCLHRKDLQQQMQKQLSKCQQISSKIRNQLQYLLSGKLSFSYLHQRAKKYDKSLRMHSYASFLQQDIRKFSSIDEQQQAHGQKFYSLLQNLMNCAQKILQLLARMKSQAQLAKQKMQAEKQKQKQKQRLITSFSLLYSLQQENPLLQINKLLSLCSQLTAFAKAIRNVLSRATTEESLRYLQQQVKKEILTFINIGLSDKKTFIAQNGLEKYSGEIGTIISEFLKCLENVQGLKIWIMKQILQRLQTVQAQEGDIEQVKRELAIEMVKQKNVQRRRKTKNQSMRRYRKRRKQKQNQEGEKEKKQKTQQQLKKQEYQKRKKKEQVLKRKRQKARQRYQRIKQQKKAKKIEKQKARQQIPLSKQEQLKRLISQRDRSKWRLDRVRKRINKQTNLIKIQELQCVLLKRRQNLTEAQRKVKEQKGKLQKPKIQKPFKSRETVESDSSD